MYVLTVWNSEQGESEVVAVARDTDQLEALAAERFEDLVQDNDCETDHLAWVVVGANELELEARVDWGWGDDEIWRIQPVKEIV